jgi:CBS domain containing-hemolysin-like protein
LKTCHAIMFARRQEALEPAAHAPRALRCFALVVLTACAMPARASFLSGEALDTAADVLAIVILFLVPIVGITAFWLVHILPEKIAEKRHHPQRDAIKTLCLLSLVFGGMLWPIAWLWAYSKPVLHKMAYGTDKHEDYYKELAEKDGKDAHALKEDVDRLQRELDVLEQRGALPEELSRIRDELKEVQPRIVEPPARKEAR